MKPSQIARILPVLIDLKLSVFLKGPVGAGKSSLVHQIGKQMGLEVRDTVRASQMDPTDLKGFPAPDLKTRSMTWLRPEFLPTKGKGILFLDELNSGHPTVQAACYQLVLDRKIGDYELPPGWAVIAAGNRETDGSIVNRTPAALNNRFVHLEYEVDLTDFTVWAMKNGISPTTIAFLRFRENLLHKYDPQSKFAAFPTPRSWVFADRIMGTSLSATDKLEAMRGTVGEAAAEYIAFAQVINQMPTADQIALDPKNTPVPEAPNVQYAVSTMLAMNTKTAAAFTTFYDYVERLPAEFQVCYMKDLMAQNVPIKTTPKFTEWCVANRDVLID
jgi:hypothetical protein